jgi:hypothetical protein
MRKPVLSDHKRIKSKLVTPFNDAFGPPREVSWINTMIPELLWIALVQEKYGARRGVEIITAFTRAVRASRVDRAKTIWAAAGKFKSIPAQELQDIMSRNGGSYADNLHVALRPLAAWYPTHPLNALFSAAEFPPEPSDLMTIKTVVEELFNRASLAATMTQATAVWLAFDADRLKVAPGLALAQFPRIEDYPNTELSKKIAAAIRAGLNSFFGDTNLMASGTAWPVAFWNRGLEIEPCGNDDGCE